MKNVKRLENEIDKRSYAPWAWKRICKVKDAMLSGYNGDWWLKVGNHYTVKPDMSGFVLLTRMRMSRWGYSGDLACCLCAAADESIPHLFFTCPYNTVCVQLVSRRLKMCIPVANAWTWWEHFSFKTGFPKKVVGAAICALIYYIWKARNHSLHNCVLIRPEIWCKSLIPEIVFRCKNVVDSNVLSKNVAWLESL
ncbi:hypothetical protein RND81_10G227300 [Saponaria officinalis]|uniref:Reverse transcriptase zinc-binding domain-containing protein n=1 Tax=Saponaria officinalis TaxID=3572 RepID=A0AAW1I7M2_SAPOF